MALQKHRDIFLATCLLESIEDENYRNTQKLLLEHHANPNLLIPEYNIAPIHYAAGMENTEFAEAVMKLILKNNGDPNIQTIEGETPLHIAVIWNRTLIVEMLLDHGADLSIVDNDNNTPISHALIEEHYNLIPIFQNYVFEEKLQKKLDAKYAENRSERVLNKRLDTVMKSFHQLDMTQNSDNDKLLTPNRTNFNFDEASPFLVNVNCRRRPKYVNVETVKFTKCTDGQTNDNNVIVISDSDENDATKDHKEKKKNFVKNLFELTEDNIEKHLSMVVKRSRKNSLIHLWRNKVNESRKRTSFLPVNEDEFEAFLSDNMAEVESVQSSQKSLETVIPVKSTGYQQCTEIEDSFITAIDEHELATVEKSLTNIDLKKRSDVVFQTQELYEHFDPEQNILFYENKLLANPMAAAIREKITDQDVINLNTSSESGTVTDLPTDYDTDDLRKELKAFGDVPGPITKNTKRLYLRRLVRYHRSRRPQESTQHSKQGSICNFSIELQKTMKNEIDSLDFINIDYSLLERQMISSFQSSQTKNMREGNLKKSFNYLLIDPRIAENILADSQVIPMSELWCRFLKAIFYVGKGKSSRPFHHLYDAIKIYRDNSLDVEKMPESLKLARIIDIWKSNKGVICLPVFHNITPVEAYTREAAIIDCVGVENLTNIKRGDYYGIVKSWSMRDRKKLGVLLLYKALQVFMIEGESQLRPNDIK
ncbi:ankyrin repeat and LEM domain-containing protein 1 [Contarinia nasturtii]|uniref:ankyrin repeat and LEM domain-containing protein 1 n=1 Tax=Contarinia nasturtii TaxID=265458 RepID=UPI0012D3944B|nr:ankyrin repeat and LEM domain-containing protein 1 [Contarinia nasturtii]